MTGVVSGLAASIGVAIVITSLTLPNRKSKEVIDATARGAVSLVEAALGQAPKFA
jgi:ABC-type nickel/cobalt efflux system permease component RcnA